MDTRGKIGIGAALILAVGTAWLLGANYSLVDAPAVFDAALIDGHPGFRLRLPQSAWSKVTEHDQHITSDELDARVHKDVYRLIELGIADQGLPCPKWILSTIIPTNGMAFEGICLDDGELVETLKHTDDSI